MLAKRRQDVGALWAQLPQSLLSLVLAHLELRTAFWTVRGGLSIGWGLAQNTKKNEYTINEGLCFVFLCLSFCVFFFS
jgi:hypothetical protein